MPRGAPALTPIPGIASAVPTTVDFVRRAHAAAGVPSCRIAVGKLRHVAVVRSTHVLLADGAVSPLKLSLKRVLVSIMVGPKSLLPRGVNIRGGGAPPDAKVGNLMYLYRNSDYVNWL